MSQGFRKIGKPYEISDTTIVPPLSRTDDHQNSRRTLQIHHLHK
jgi:hypothetical protein